MPTSLPLDYYDGTLTPKQSKNMAQIKFYRGLAAKYSTTTHSNGVYFATDTYEIWMNGKSYGNIANLSITNLTDATGATNLEFGKSYEIKAANGTDTIKLTMPTPEEVKISATSAVGTYITVSLNDGALGIDETALATALSNAADAYKGQTTLTGGGDLKDGSVTVTLGGNGAAANQSITISDTRAAKADQELSNDATTNSHAYSGSQKINLSGVEGAGSSATIVMPDAQTITSTGTAAFGASNQKITISDATSSNEVSIALPSLDATANAEDTLIKAEMSAGVIDVTAELTSSTATATKIATKEYVDEKAAAEATVYSFNKDAVSFEKGEGENVNKYTATVQLDKKVGDATAVKASDVTLTLDVTDILALDGMLDSVAWNTEEGHENELVFTWNTAAGKTATSIDLSKYIDTYTAGNGIDITNHTVSVKVPTNGYLDATADGVIIKSTMIQKGAAEGASDLLATKGYVDEQITASNVTVTKTDVSAFGASGSITVKTSAADTTGTTFQVSLPSFTEGKSTSENVAVSIANDGKISVTSSEQGAADTTTYSNTKLAQASYVDEEIAKAVAGVTGGDDEVKSGDNVLLKIENAATTADPTLTASITTKDSANNTLTSTALATKEYVDAEINALGWIEVE